MKPFRILYGYNIKIPLISFPRREISQLANTSFRSICFKSAVFSLWFISLETNEFCRMQVSWRDKDMTSLTWNTVVLTEDRRFSVQRKYQNDWDLQITGVKLTDAGNYSCCIVVTTGQCNTHKVVTLIIQSKSTAIFLPCAITWVLLFRTRTI